MTQLDLMTELAEIITDMRRLDYDNDDPMRYSKRMARELAGSILRDACQQARAALALVGSIEHDQRTAVEVKP